MAVGSIIEAIGVIQEQTRRVKNELKRLRLQKEQAEAAFKNAEVTYDGAKRIAERNLRRLRAKSEELNELLTSKTGRPWEEIRETTTMLELEPLTQTNTIPDEDERHEDGERDTDAYLQPPRARSTSHVWSTTSQWPASKHSRIKEKLASSQPSMEDSRMLDLSEIDEVPQSILRSAKDTGGDSSVHYAGSKKHTRFDVSQSIISESAGSIPLPYARGASLHSHLEVTHPRSPTSIGAAVHEMHEPELRRLCHLTKASPQPEIEKTPLSEQNHCYVTDSDSSDGLFVSEKRRYKMVPAKTTSQLGFDPGPSITGRKDDLMALEGYDDFSSKPISESSRAAFSSSAKRSDHRGLRPQRGASRGHRRSSKATSSFLDSLVTNAVLGKLVSKNKETSIQAGETCSTSSDTANHSHRKIWPPPPAAGHPESPAPSESSDGLFVRE